MTPWPALDWEAQTWRPATESWRPAKAPATTTYRSAVPPFIGGRRLHLDPETATLADEATLELTRLDSELGPRIAAFAPVLLRSESASSSQIENLTASAHAIFRAELGVRTRGNADAIVANTHALQAAIALSDALSSGSILRMHEALMSGQPRHSPGQWRQEPVWIGTRSDSPVGAVYVAPHHSRVAPLVEDLVTFCADSAIPALAAVAVAHAQFETIHPFTDGNGRTGRALAQALLRHRGVTRNVAVPVSAGLLADVEGYHRALTVYRDGDPSDIVRAFANASLRAIGNARTLVQRLDSIRDSWNERLTARRNSNAWRVLDLLIRQPVLDSATIATELGVAQPNVYPPMRALVEAGIVVSKHEHRLGSFWRSNEVLAQIDAFAERAGRRELPVAPQSPPTPQPLVPHPPPLATPPHEHTE